MQKRRNFFSSRVNKTAVSSCVCRTRLLIISTAELYFADKAVNVRSISHIRLHNAKNSKLYSEVRKFVLSRVSTKDFELVQNTRTVQNILVTSL